jgi:hypothetical protein
MVGELIRSLDPKPVDRTSPGDRSGRVPARLGNITGQRRASRLARGRAYRRCPRRGPGGRTPMARQWPLHVGDELPDNRWPPAEPQDFVERPDGIAHAARPATCRPGALSAATVHRQHRDHLGRPDRPRDRDRDIVTGHEECHRPTPRTTRGLSTQRLSSHDDQDGSNIVLSQIGPAPLRIQECPHLFIDSGFQSRPIRQIGGTVGH